MVGSATQGTGIPESPAGRVARQTRRWLWSVACSAIVGVLGDGGDGMPAVWYRSAGECPVLSRLWFPRRGVAGACRVQAGDGVIGRRGSFDGYRGGGGRGAVARDHGRAGQPLRIGGA